LNGSWSSQKALLRTGVIWRSFSSPVSLKMIQRLPCQLSWRRGNEKESVKAFVERFQNMALWCPSGMTQATLVKICCHNLQTSLLAQIEVAKSRTWKKLVQQDEKAEEIVTRVKAEESKLRPEKLIRHAPESSFQAKRKDTQQRRCLPPSPNRLELVVLQTNHSSTSSTPSRTTMLYPCSSYTTRITDWSFLKLDVLRRWARLTIPSTACTTGC